MNYHTQILEAISKHPLSMRQAAISCNMPYRTFIERAKRMGVYNPNPNHKGRQLPNKGPASIPLEDIVSGKTVYKASSAKLKQRLLDQQLKDNQCEECGISNEWNGKPLTLQLDHIDGNKYNNKLSNLQILCPNCHTQTPTHGRKKGMKKHVWITEVTTQQIKEAITPNITITQLAEKLNLNPKSESVRSTLRSFLK